jgi:hypothetical protein
MKKEIKLYNGEVTVIFNDSNHSYWTESEELKKDGKPKLKRLCGVTTYCGIVDKSQALIPWAVNTTVDYIRDRIELLKEARGYEILEMARGEADRQKDLAAEIGKAIHKWVEDHINGKEPEMPEDSRVLEGVNNFLEWKEKNKVKFLWTEKIVYYKDEDDEEIEYVGTADIGIEIDGKKYLLDIKTGNDIYPEVKMQTAAYLKAEMKESGTEYAGRYALRITKETKEEYTYRMEQKVARYKRPFKYADYKLFEAIFLDDDPEELVRDFNGFLATIKLKKWKDKAFKNLISLKK